MHTPTNHRNALASAGTRQFRFKTSFKTVTIGSTEKKRWTMLDDDIQTDNFLFANYVFSRKSPEVILIMNVISRE